MGVSFADTTIAFVRESDRPEHLLGHPESGGLNNPSAWASLRPNTQPYKFIGFGDIHGPKPYTFIGLGDTNGPKPYKFMKFLGGYCSRAVLGFPTNQPCANLKFTHNKRRAADGKRVGVQIHNRRVLHQCPPLQRTGTANHTVRMPIFMCV